MSKYIVTVYFNNGNNQILTVKAKNDTKLDIKIAKELKAIFGSLDSVNYVEYDKVKRYMFTKNVYWQLAGTLVGREALKELLNKVDVNEMHPESFKTGLDTSTSEDKQIHTATEIVNDEKLFKEFCQNLWQIPEDLIDELFNNKK